MGALLKILAGIKTGWDWFQAWRETPWGQATTEVLAERVHLRRARATAVAADGDPATGEGPLSPNSPGAMVDLEAVKTGLLERLATLYKRLPVLSDQTKAHARLADLERQLEETEAWIRRKAATS